LEVLLLGLFVDPLDELAGLGLLLRRGVIELDGIARGQGFVELAFLEPGRAQVDEVLGLRNARDRLLELLRRFSGLVGVHRLLALFIEPRSDLGLGLGASGTDERQGKRTERKRAERPKRAKRNEPSHVSNPPERRTGESYHPTRWAAVISPAAGPFDFYSLILVPR